MASEANGRLCDAAKRGDIAEIELQIAAGADANAFEGTADMTPLLWAAHGGHVAAIAALLAAGARVDIANSHGTTPLMRAVLHGHTAAVAALLAAGVDVHCARNDGYTVLHGSSAYGRLDTACVLLDVGARTDVRDKDGRGPIDVVCPLAR
jgi:uncharacterized protein